MEDDRRVKACLIETMKYLQTELYICSLFFSFIPSTNSKLLLFSLILNKLITYTGYFMKTNDNDNYVLNGKYIFHDRYG